MKLFYITFNIELHSETSWLIYEADKMFLFLFSISVNENKFRRLINHVNVV